MLVLIPSNLIDEESLGITFSGFFITNFAAVSKNLSKSLLDQIQGIGKQRKRALLNHFGSARAVESASFDDLKSVEGIEDNIAKKIYDYFHE